MTSATGRPTLLDVARAAGVSRATASRVLAGQTTVDPELADRVQMAARRLNYRTNTAARALRSGASSSVAVIAPNSELEGLAGPFVGAPLRGATTTLLEQSLLPVLLLDDGQEPSPLVPYLTSGHVDGAVVILQRESETLFRQLRGLPIPIVYVGHPTTELAEEDTLVDSDNYGGARLATRALLEAGRRRIATIAGRDPYLPALERLRGFIDELEAWGLPPGPVARGDFTMASGSAAMAQLLRRSPDVDGLFAQSDLMAVGAMRVLSASGRQVPTDVSVVGFDDTVVAATADPPLTSVHQPLQEMGSIAAELVVRSLGAPITEPRHVLAETRLVVRESV